MKILWLLLILLAPQAALAARDPAALCENAAQIAAQREGIPPDVMRALTLTETGHRRDGVLRPWPWAINRAGEGHWFQTQAEAMAYARSALASGARNFDVGCFQLNHRWHADGFSDLAAMFDPMQNALYAARFLRDQYTRTGDWTRAAGAYHSLTPEFAARYRTRFAALRDGLDLPALPVAQAVVRDNTFPFFRGGRGDAGSLVPSSTSNGALLASAGQRLIGN